MTLFIATTDGTTNFRLDQAEVDLISIAKVDTGIGFTENATQAIEGVTTVPVTYTQTETGPTPTRLNALVNNVGFTAPPHIVIFGVDDSFVLSDGTPLKGNGVAIPVGMAGNPFTAHVATFYDVTLCGGAGVWVDKEGGGTTQESTDVILYHELSHCFHFVTSTTAPTSALEEQAAETDENDMRDVLGFAHREVTSHNGGCGGGPPPSCCIVASLATGSPYSAEVNTFRHYREHVLRGSDVGDDFFQRFHTGYYSFSPEVVRLMGHRPGLGDVVRTRYVAPLLAAVELLIHYADSGGRDLAALLRGQLQRPGCGELFAALRLRHLARGAAAAASQPPAPDADWSDGSWELPEDIRSAVAELATHITTRRTDDELLRWALVDIVGIWTAGMLAVHAATPDPDVDRMLQARIAGWLGRMPVTPVWQSFSRLKAAEELGALRQFFVDAGARQVFAGRLGAAVPRHASTAAQWASSPWARSQGASSQRVNSQWASRTGA